MKRAIVKNYTQSEISISLRFDSIWHDFHIAKDKAKIKNIEKLLKLI